MRTNSATRAFVLLEVILALTIFSIVIVALARSLQSAVEAATIQQKEETVQEQMRSLLDWVRLDPKDPERIKPVTLNDQVKLTPSLTLLEVKNKKGENIPSLYNLKIDAEIPTPTTNFTRTIQMTLFIP